MSIWTMIWASVDVFSQRANGPQTLPMCSLYHIVAMGSHGDAKKATWVRGIHLLMLILTGGIFALLGAYNLKTPSSLVHLRARHEHDAHIAYG